MVEIEFKACTVCKNDRPATNDFFNKKSSTADLLQNVCKNCNAKSSKKHYEANKEKIKQRTRDRVRRIKPLAQQLVLQYLKVGCTDCGEKDIVVLEFDHQGDKKYEIARMINEAYSLDKLEEEINKCVVRCANCHRRKTAKDYGWWKLDTNNTI
jgi:ribosomal protein S27E